MSFYHFQTRPLTFSHLVGIYILLNFVFNLPLFFTFCDTTYMYPYYALWLAMVRSIYVCTVRKGCLYSASLNYFLLYGFLVRPSDDGDEGMSGVY